MAKSNRRLMAGLVARTVLRIGLYVAAIGILCYAGQYAYHVGYAVFSAGSMEEAPGRDVTVTIGERMSDREVGELLEAKGLIEDSFIFLIQAKVYEYDPLPGTYLLNTSQTLDRMMEIMSVTPKETSA